MSFRSRTLLFLSTYIYLSEFRLSLVSSFCIPTVGRLWSSINSLADGTRVTVDNLKKAHPRLFQCLQAEVAQALKWTQGDIESNNGSLHDRQKPAKMMDLESKLAFRRTFRVSRLPLGWYPCQYSLPGSLPKVAFLPLQGSYPNFQKVILLKVLSQKIKRWSATIGNF